MQKMPPVQTDFYALNGGLDLESPAISISPGKCFDAQNYEPNTSGGYRRIDGYERFNGAASPSASNYWVITAAITGTVTVGATLTGLVSGATGRVLGVFGSIIVLGRVTGTYVSAEALRISGVTVATSTSLADQNSAPNPSDHADYRLLAANDIRTDILVVPGSGQIRGVWVYNDIVFAFRDNAGGTAGDMYKSSGGGWVKIIFGKEIQFTSAVGQINDGDVITGATSAATAIVTRAMLRAGTWTSAGVGTLIVGSVTGTFQSGEALQTSAVTKVTSSSLCTSITRAAGGQVAFVNANFTSSTNTTKMYGADGVNLCFEFDGTNYIPIRTGMVTDTPKHISYHRGHLFLSFLGSVQFSGLTLPYAWTAVLGAGEIAAGDVVTGLVEQTGNFSGSSLAVFTKTKTAILYGSGPSTYQLVPSIHELGYSAYTISPVSNNTYGLTARGIQALITTLNYGDFNYAAVSFDIQTYLGKKQGLETVSTTSRAKNQYRLYFSDNTAIVTGLTGEKVNGLMPLNYGRVVRCIVTTTLTTGIEVTYFGSDDGYVYKDNTGTSFDGAAIESWIRPAFNNLKSPRLRKRYRRAVFEVTVEGFTMVNATYDLGYATPNVAPTAVQKDLSLVGAGGYWDQIVWDQFTWDTQIYATPQISIEGTEKNISFLFYSNRAQDSSHTVSGVSLMYTPRRTER
jgi:hypothetical protein